MSRHSTNITEISPERRKEQAQEQKKSGRVGIYIAIALALSAIPFVWGWFSPFTAGVQ
ncbi:MAG: hypothetical protein AAF737_02265 [Pseudomonadota bacterium]